MMVTLNSSERTIGQFVRLFKDAGWEITAVRRPTGKDVMALAAILSKSWETWCSPAQILDGQTKKVNM